MLDEFAWRGMQTGARATKFHLTIDIPSCLHKRFGNRGAAQSITRTLCCILDSIHRIFGQEVKSRISMPGKPLGGIGFLPLGEARLLEFEV